MKYCPSCGRQNEDQAAFCTGCGQKFPEASDTSQTIPVAAQAQPASVFTVEQGPGAHAHMMTDFFLKDAGGKALLTAKLQSLLHENYTIVDAGGATIGRLETKTHLTHRTMSLVDADGGFQQAVSVGSVHSKGVLPGCWLEDAAGNKDGYITFPGGLMGFSVEYRGKEVLDASALMGVGVVQDIRSMERRTYSLDLLDPSLPLQLVLATVVAVVKLVTY